MPLRSEAASARTSDLDVGLPGEHGFAEDELPDRHAIESACRWPSIHVSTLGVTGPVKRMARIIWGRIQVPVWPPRSACERVQYREKWSIRISQPSVAMKRRSVLRRNDEA
jgi:hypothetical protein